MEDYLHGMKQIAKPLASICSLVSDLHLAQLTLNGIDKDYHILTTILYYGANLLTFDDL